MQEQTSRVATVTLRAAARTACHAGASRSGDIDAAIQPSPIRPARSMAGSLWPPTRMGMGRWTRCGGSGSIGGTSWYSPWNSTRAHRAPSTGEARDVSVAAPAPIVPGHAHGLGLFPEPADAHAVDDAPAAVQVEGGQLPGVGDGVADGEHGPPPSRA